MGGVAPTQVQHARFHSAMGQLMALNRPQAAVPTWLDGRFGEQEQITVTEFAESVRSRVTRSHHPAHPPSDRKWAATKTGRTAGNRLISHPSGVAVVDWAGLPVRHQARRRLDQDRADVIAELIEFLPIFALDGGRMDPVDVNAVMDWGTACPVRDGVRTRGPG
jgi:hypothetical protein